MTEGDVDRMLASIRSEMRSGFNGINARLDRVNGRLDKTDDVLSDMRPALAEHGIQIAALRREEGRRRVERHEHQGSRVVLSMPIDVRTVTAIFLTAGALMAAAVLAWLNR